MVTFGYQVWSGLDELKKTLLKKKQSTIPQTPEVVKKPAMVPTTQPKPITNIFDTVPTKPVTVNPAMQWAQAMVKKPNIFDYDTMAGPGTKSEIQNIPQVEIPKEAGTKKVYEWLLWTAVKWVKKWVTQMWYDVAQRAMKKISPTEDMVAMAPESQKAKTREYFQWKFPDVQYQKLQAKEQAFMSNPELASKYQKWPLTALLDRDRKQLSDPEYRGELVGQWLWQWLPAIALTLATKSPSLASLAFYPQMQQEAFEDIDTDEATKNLPYNVKEWYSALLWAINTAIESIGLQFMATPFLRAMRKEIIWAVLESPLKWGLKALAKTVGWESWEEVLQRLTSDIMAKFFWSKRNLPTLEELWNIAIEAAASVGPIAGAWWITAFQTQRWINDAIQWAKSYTERTIPREEMFQEQQPAPTQQQQEQPKITTPTSSPIMEETQTDVVEEKPMVTKPTDLVWETISPTVEDTVTRQQDFLKESETKLKELQTQQQTTETQSETKKFRTIIEDIKKKLETRKIVKKKLINEKAPDLIKMEDDKSVWINGTKEYILKEANRRFGDGNYEVTYLDAWEWRYRGMIRPTKKSLIAKKDDAPIFDDLTKYQEKELQDTLRKSKGLTADDIMAKYPDINLKREVAIKDVQWKKHLLKKGEALTPYELKGWKVLLQDGETYVVTKNQRQNIKWQSIVGEDIKADDPRFFMKELRGTEETTLWGKNIAQKVEMWDEAAYESLPNNVKKILENDPEGDYEKLKKMKAKLNEIWWDMDYDLDGEISSLSKMDEWLPTKYSQYTLPWWENYKEILIQAPIEKLPTVDIKRKEVIDWVQRQTKHDWITYSITKDSDNVYYASQFKPWQDIWNLWLKRPSLEDTKRDIESFISKKITGKDNKQFKWSHREQPNVLAHLRMNERTYNWKKVTFMEELQSDWAREYRKWWWWATPEELARLENATKEYEDRQKIMASKKTTEETTPGNYKVKTTATKADFDKTDKLRTEKEIAESEVNKKLQVPWNPLLKNRQELAIKRALKEAVDNGAEYFAWINWEQTAARYNLSKQVDYISWKEDKTYENYWYKLISIKPLGSAGMYLTINKEWIVTQSPPRMSADGKNIADVVWKWLAEKIIWDKSWQLQWEWLNIGWERAFNLYDRVVPNIIKDLTGKTPETIEMGLKEAAIWLSNGLYIKVWQWVIPLWVDDLKVWKTIYYEDNMFIITKVGDEWKFEAAPQWALSKTSVADWVIIKDKDIINIWDQKYIFSKWEVKSLQVSNWKNNKQQSIQLTPDVIAKITWKAFLENKPSWRSPITNTVPTELENTMYQQWVKWKVITQQEAISKAYEMYPNIMKYLTVKATEKIFTPKGTEAFGSYKDRLVSIAKDPLNTTMDHELFHAVVDLFLDTSEKKALFAEIEKATGIKDMVKAEERAARRFERYAQWKQTTKSNKVLDFFRKIRDAIKWVFGNKSMLDKLYADMTNRNKQWTVKKEWKWGSIKFEDYWDRIVDTIQTPEFKRWFGDREKDPANASKVVDKEGKPLVVYHGSDKNFEAFRPSSAGWEFPDASYFTDNKKIAETYSIGGGTDYEVFLNIKNPYIVDAKWRDYNGMYVQLLSNMDYAKRNGYDWMIIKNFRDDWYQKGDKTKGNTFVVFEPNQIKSAYENQWGFDPYDDRMKYQSSMRDMMDPERINFIQRVAKIESQEQRIGTIAGKKVSAEVKNKQMRQREKDKESLIEEIGSTYWLDANEARDKYDDFANASYAEINMTATERKQKLQKQMEEYYGKDPDEKKQLLRRKPAKEPKKNLMAMNKEKLKAKEDVKKQEQQLQKIEKKPLLTKKQQWVKREVWRMVSARNRWKSVDEIKAYNRAKDILNETKKEKESRYLWKTFYDANKPMKKQKPDLRSQLGEFMSDLIEPVSYRLWRISKTIQNRVRLYDYSEMNAIKNIVDASRQFLDKMAEIRKDPIKYNEADLALKNRDTEKLKELWIEVPRDILDMLINTAQDLGVDVGYLEDYFPRVVADARGLLSKLRGTEAWSYIDDAIKAREKTLWRELTKEEQAEIANKLISWYSVEGIRISVGNMQERSIDIINSDLNRYYMDAVDGYLNYVSAMVKMIEMKKLFGHEDPEKAIGTFIVEMKEKGKLKPEQEEEVLKIMKARFGMATSNRLIQTVWSMISLSTMGSPISTLSQIQDLANSIFISERDIFGRLSIDVTKDLWIDTISEEYSETWRLQRFTKKVFTATGFRAMDKLWKNALINTTYRKYVREAKTDPMMLSDELMEMFDDQRRVDTIIRDLQNNVLSEDVKFLLFDKLADFQPITRTEMPVKFLQWWWNPLFYKLKSFAIKQIASLRREWFDKIKDWYRRYNKADRLKQEWKITQEQADRYQKKARRYAVNGATNLLKLATYLVLMWAAVDEVKDLILMRKSSNILALINSEDTSFDDRLIQNMFKLSGLTKYAIMQAGKQWISQTIWSTIGIPMGIIDQVARDAIMVVTNNSLNPGDKLRALESIQSLPVIGKMYYRRFGQPTMVKDSYDILDPQWGLRDNKYYKDIFSWEIIKKKTKSKSLKLK